MNDCSHSKSSYSLTSSLNSIELNNPEHIMIYLTTNPIDEDTTYHPKHRYHKNKKTITPNKLCHHIKSPVKFQQNKTINPTYMPSQPPIFSHIASSLQSEKNANLYNIQNLTFGDEI